MSDPEILGPGETFDEPRPGSGLVAKFLTVAAGIVGVVALGGLVWFAYQQGVRSGAERAAPTVRAEIDPVKRKPDEPGGLEVPHQDKLVFSRLAPGQAEEPVERLLPPPEEPAGRATAQSAPPAAAQTPKPPPPAPVAAAPAAAAQEPVAAAAPPPRAAEAEKPAEAAPPSAPAPVARSAKPAKSGAASSAIVPPVAAFWRIQLAAVSSRKLALSAWEQMKRRHDDLLGALTLNIEPVKLRKGTFFRVQAGPLKERSKALGLCRELKSRNQDCLLVVPVKPAT